MEGNFGGCKLWRNGKESIIGGINFGGYDKSLIKRILKQFEYKSTRNWSIRVHVFANAD